MAIDTPSLKGSLNLVGGRIDDLKLADYRETVDPTSPLVELFRWRIENPYFADFGWVAPEGGPAVPGAETEWKAEGGSLAPGQDLTLTYDNGAGLTFKRTYSVDAKYMFTVRQTVENTTDAPVTLDPFGLVSRTGLPKTSGYDILHEGLIGYLGDDGLQEIKYKKLNDEDRRSRRPRHRPAGSASPTNTGRPRSFRASDQPFQPRFLKGASGRAPDLSGGLSRRRRRRSRRRHGDHGDAALCRRQGDGAPQQLRGEARASRISTF